MRTVTSLIAAVVVLVTSHVMAADPPPAQPAQPQPPAKRPARPAPPARDPHTPGYVDAKELPHGEVPPANVDGNFIIGPTHKPARELANKDTYPQGQVTEFVIKSADSKIYPGIARDP